MMRLILLLVLFALAVLPAQAEVSLFADSPLTTAVKQNDVEGVRTALVDRPNTNQTIGNGKSLLMLAVESGNVAIVKLLLENRANPDRADDMGNTALMYAVPGADLDVMEALVMGGKTSLDSQNRQGMTALMMAARDGKHALVQYLLEAGAKHQLTDYTGRTALDWAKEGRNKRCIELLDVDD